MGKRQSDVKPEELEDQIRTNKAKEKPEPFVSVQNLQKQRQFAMNTKLDEFFDNHDDYEIEYTVYYIKQKQDLLRRNYDNMFTPLL